MLITLIRNWKARINGKDNVLPFFAEYYTAGGNYGDPSGIINITPPADCYSFTKGDFIEAEVELIIIPSNAADYYGPSKNFANALLKDANSWKMVYREALGNDIGVKVSTGTLINSYPLKIAAKNSQAEFSVTGGCGYVPLTITNVSNYQNPNLYRKVNGNWQRISQEVYGNDYWQMEYNAANGTWDITYNVNLDSPNDVRQTLEFRFDNASQSH